MILNIFKSVVLTDRLRAVQPVLSALLTWHLPSRRSSCSTSSLPFFSAAAWRAFFPRLSARVGSAPNFISITAV